MVTSDPRSYAKTKRNFADVSFPVLQRPRGRKIAGSWTDYRRASAAAEARGWERREVVR